MDALAFEFFDLLEFMTKKVVENKIQFTESEKKWIDEKNKIIDEHFKQFKLRKKYSLL